MKGDIRRDYLKVAQTINSIENEKQICAVEKMLDNFFKKWFSFRVKNDAYKRFKELSEFLHRKKMELKNIEEKTF